ncbi:MAG: glycosyltransferase family 4 protein [Patescibacteria group bacterium]
MKIGVDCRLSGLHNAGIGRYISNLVVRLPQIDQNVFWVFFFLSTAQAEEVLGNLIKHKNIKIVLAPIRHYSLKEQFLFPLIVLRERLDLFYVPHFNIPVFYPGKIVITIHDLLWHQQRGSEVTTLSNWVYWLKYFGYLLTVTVASIRAKLIFVPSNFVKDDLGSFYPWTKQKTVVTFEGVDQHYLNKKIPVSSKKRKKRLIYTGSLYPHKNLQLVLKSLSQLPSYQLIIIGSRNIFQDKTKELIKQLAVGKQVTFAGYLSDQQLIEVYNQSFALVVPSLSEGFGLPGVEAMAVGLPVLASDIPVFREIYQQGVIYFDPSSVQSFVAAVKKLEKTNLQVLTKTAKEISQQYSWNKTANIILSLSCRLFNK